MNKTILYFLIFFITIFIIGCTVEKLEEKESNDSFEKSFVLPVDGLITNASIESVIDVDYYRFPIKANISYYIKLEWYKKDKMNLEGIIYDKDKKKMKEIYKFSSDDNSSDKTFYYSSFYNNLSQDCYIKIYDYNGTGTGSYEISIREANR
ncbi:MAG: hypothetical protein A2086_06590 [Spirochaetes bacterium GWD1_27_9]|nr:MAG: hypothetical protein A2Z98_15720 [Spirochaetes bacterium GWB1_27_13]OHD26363.1 MAG: hypothetical protein A2Y34_05705 [Spirochaetes bacterium GWC1_27_15]OHD41307.1 MAG: hypothetical protein A2086_06590 [Spirochaetes bacterium GWD1_27_9]